MQPTADKRKLTFFCSRFLLLADSTLAQSVRLARRERWADGGERRSGSSGSFCCRRLTIVRE